MDRGFSLGSLSPVLLLMLRYQALAVVFSLIIIINNVRLLWVLVSCTDKGAWSTMNGLD